MISAMPARLKFARAVAARWASISKVVSLPPVFCSAMPSQMPE